MIEKNIVASIDRAGMTGVTWIEPTAHNAFAARVVTTDPTDDTRESATPVRAFDEGQKGPGVFLKNGQPAGCGTKGAPIHV